MLTEMLLLTVNILALFERSRSGVRKDPPDETVNNLTKRMYNEKKSVWI